MTTTLENIDDLISKPYGCGEQNMVNFAPMIYALDYLFASKQDTPEFVQKAKDFMKFGEIFVFD